MDIVKEEKDAPLLVNTYKLLPIYGIDL